MTKSETIFYNRYKNSMNLVFHPHIIKHGVVRYTPDFLDTNTGTYYEVITSRQSYYSHKTKKDFDYTTETNRLVIAMYCKTLDVFYLEEYSKDRKFSPNFGLFKLYLGDDYCGRKMQV